MLLKKAEGFLGSPKLSVHSGLQELLGTVGKDHCLQSFVTFACLITLEK